MKNPFIGGARGAGASEIEMKKTAPVAPLTSLSRAAARATTAEKKPAHGGQMEMIPLEGDEMEQSRITRESKVP